MTSVKASEVASLFGVSVAALQVWHRSNILRAHPKGVSFGYSEAIIDAFLAQKMRGKPSEPITFEDLRTNRIKLVDIKAAHTLTGIPTWKLYATISSGQGVTSLALTYQTILLVKADVEALPRPKNVTTVHNEQAARIFGVGADRIERWGYQGELERVHLGRHRAFSLDSVIAHSATLLPPWINAADWVAEVMDSPLPLVSFTEITRQFGSRSEQLMNSGKLRYISTSGTRKKDSFRRYLLWNLCDRRRK